MTDKTLTCRDCSVDFVFTASEQDLFASKGFTNEPSRCPGCREARKANRDSSYSGGGYTSGGSGRREREMHPAVCAQCGKDTQVPFVPRGDKPVYCSDCYEKQRGSSYSSGGRGGRGNRW